MVENARGRKWPATVAPKRKSNVAPGGPQQVTALQGHYAPGSNEEPSAQRAIGQDGYQAAAGPTSRSTAGYRTPDSIIQTRDTAASDGSSAVQGAHIANAALSSSNMLALPDFDAEPFATRPSGPTAGLFAEPQRVESIYNEMNILYESFPMSDNFDHFFLENQALSWNEDVFRTGVLHDLFDTNVSELNDLDTIAPVIYDPQTAATLPGEDEHADVYDRFRTFSNIVPSRPPSPRSQSTRQHWFAAAATVDTNLFTSQHQKIIDEFLWLFQSRVAGFLSLFRDKVVFIEEETPTEWYLAMAAVGGLFCKVKGSIKIAKWLYHSARRRLNSKVYMRESQIFTFDEGCKICETYILMELFGYLVGDTKIYEMLEVFHLQMLQVARSIGIFAPTVPARSPLCAEFREAFLLLECYRVVFDQRPPLLASSQTASGANSATDGFESLFRSLLLSEMPSNRTIEPSDSLSTLAVLAALTWNVVPPGFVRHVPLKGLWSSSFCEMALHRWVQAHTTSPAHSLMILFHVIHINMLVCLPAIQNLVVRYLASEPSTGTTDRLETQQESARSLPDKRDTKTIFSNPAARPKAVWHAHQILNLARRVLDELELGISANVESAQFTRYADPPHYAHSVSCAVLTLWSDSYLATGETTPQKLRRWPDYGVRLLRQDEGSEVERLYRSIFVDLSARSEASF